VPSNINEHRWVDRTIKSRNQHNISDCVVGVSLQQLLLLLLKLILKSHLRLPFYRNDVTSNCIITWLINIQVEPETNRQQSWTFNFVADLFPVQQSRPCWIQLCCQCVPGLRSQAIVACTVTETELLSDVFFLSYATTTSVCASLTSRSSGYRTWSWSVDLVSVR